MGGDGRRREGDGNWKTGGPERPRFIDNDDHFPEILRRAEPARPPISPPEPGDSRPNTSRNEQEPRAAPDLQGDAPITS